MIWRRHYTQLTTAAPEAVYKRWTTPGDWAIDDPGLREATFASPPHVGAVGRVCNHGSPAQKFVFTELRPNEAMNFRISLPGADLSFPHTMESTSTGLRVTHAVELSGPIAAVYAAIIGRKIARGLPAVVRLVTSNAVNEGER